jgi:cytoskeletal protein CcmA (bactofilin family)
MALEPPGVIGKGISIKGNLSGEGDLIIEGTVEGQISLKNHLTIEETGVVRADIEAERLTIKGEMNGNISASDRVRCWPTPRWWANQGAGGGDRGRRGIPRQHRHGSAASRRPVKRKEITMANVIGSTIVIEGEISGDEDLIIQGTVKGKIALKDSLIVEKVGCG